MVNIILIVGLLLQDFFRTIWNSRANASPPARAYAALHVQKYEAYLLDENKYLDNNVVTCSVVVVIVY